MNVKDSKKKRRRDEEYYSGSVYERQDFWRFRLAKLYLSGVSIADEEVNALKELVGEGVIVYAIKQRSKLNSLIITEITARTGLPRPVYCHGMNMSLWQPLTKMLRFYWSSFLRRFRKKRKTRQCKLDYMAGKLADQRSVVIHLGESEFIEYASAQDAVATLIDLQPKLSFPIFIVPLLVGYGRRREKENESLFNILFGQMENTGTIRRLITFMRYFRQAFVLPAQPVNLQEYLSANQVLTRDEMIQDLRGELIDRIEEEKAAIVGPALKSRAELIGMVMHDPKLKHFLEDYSRRHKKDISSVVKEARRYLYEIAADYQETFIEIWLRALTWLWNTVYDGVSIDAEGLARIRNLSKKMPFVIVSCHRSHIDYLLLSYVFYKNNIQLPFIAAGNNLSFFPLGYVFRRSGAFFLRRSFRGNEVYGEVFAKYMATLLREGLPLEFFIEGGRSRTGKMVMPKYGLLSMIIQAYQEGYCENFAAVPVYIGYDRVIEERAYLNELAGAPKVPENTAEIIKTTKILRKRFGRVYINIGEPIVMKEYLEAQDKPIEEMTIDERQSLYRKIGYESVLKINKVSVVTPFAMVSSGLLSHDRRGISQDQLNDIINEFYEYLSSRQIKLAETFSRRDKAIADALNIFDQTGVISKIEALEEEEEMQEVVYSLEDTKRLNLEYYKNNILHFFLPICFVATSMIKHREDSMSLAKIMSDYKFMKWLLWNEFIFDDQRDDVVEVDEVLAYLHGRGMIITSQKNGEVWIEVKSRGGAILKPFTGLIHNYLESYWIVIRSLVYLKKKPLTEREWLAKIRPLGDRMYRKGEVLRAEALSQANYSNAIKFLEDAELIVSRSREEKGGRRETIYAPSDNRAELEVLRRRLFRFL
ncbi:MAG TPA: 1-acyl-sn-glycerol-3-phosphate acyltransferase [Smithellaceae bacterium]|nr:1-acyl-sn-glycerol-3-phosphate acyltransferase [Smithellaceae bacterium]HQG79903.1 1-acyl-sn-glycerol-3-phosphate acyltransferase [Smithellaceae bacterium]